MIFATKIRMSEKYFGAKIQTYSFGLGGPIFLGWFQSVNQPIIVLAQRRSHQCFAI